MSSELGGDVLGSALRSGIHRVIAEQDTLNRINVFPVADGDTGTNLSLSLGAALGTLGRAAGEPVGRLLVSVADTMLDSARGNSGAIVAQFFQGMSDHALELASFTSSSFARAVSLGSEYAHDALAEPREGTILSVIAAFAGALSGREHGDDLHAALESAVAAAERALQRTPEQLDVLRKAGVVDAGAQGFCALVAGMTDHIVHGRATARPRLADTLEVVAGESPAAGSDAPGFRYCTECIVTGDDIDRRKLRETLSSLGDSLVLAGTRRKAKIHIHVDEPDRVFELAGRFGELGAIKADDMRRQQRGAHGAGTQFAVIVDSAADIADEDLERLDIHIVPCRIQFGDRGYLDKVSISSAGFFRELEQNPAHPTTSQPAPGDFRRQYQHLASHFADVVSINLTPTVSGTLQAAQSAAERVDAAGRVHVVNSRSASVGQGLLAVHAAECALSGRSVDDTLAAIEALVPATRTFGLLSDMRYAVRGGRLPGWVRAVAEFLRVQPVLCTRPDGTVGVSGVLPGRRDLLRKFAHFVARRVDDRAPLRVSIGHAVCADDARRLEALLREQLPGIEKLSIVELGAALGAHGGPGSLVVALQDPRAATIR